MHAIARIFTAATELGGTIPAEISAIYDNWNAACEAADNLQPTTELFADSIINSNPKTIAKTVETTATRSVVAERAHDMVNAIEGHTTHRITQALRGDSGTHLVESLRPTFDQAAHAVTAAPFTPDTARNLGAVVELGDEAVAAWRGLPKHAATLDRLYRDVVIALTSQLNLLPEPAEAGPGARYMALIIDSASNTNLALAASVFNSAAGTGEPGAGWHRLINKGYQLRLNTPAEAADIIEHWNDDIAAEQQRREVNVTAAEPIRCRERIEGGHQRVTYPPARRASQPGGDAPTRRPPDLNRADSLPSPTNVF